MSEKVLAIRFRGKVSVNSDSNTLQVKVVAHPKRHHVVGTWNNLWTEMYIEALTKSLVGGWIDLNNPLVLEVSGQPRDGSVSEVTVLIGNRMIKKEFENQLSAVKELCHKQGVSSLASQYNLHRKFCIGIRQVYDNENS